MESMSGDDPADLLALYQPPRLEVLDSFRIQYSHKAAMAIDQASKTVLGKMSDDDISELVC